MIHSEWYAKSNPWDPCFLLRCAAAALISGLERDCIVARDFLWRYRAGRKLGHSQPLFWRWPRSDRLWLASERWNWTDRQSYNPRHSIRGDALADRLEMRLQSCQKHNARATTLRILPCRLARMAEQSNVTRD